jgi:hypothetical protein
MDLEYTLSRYGVTPDYWKSASTPEVTLKTAYEELRSVLLDMPEAEARELLLKLIDDEIHHDKPMYLSLAEIYAQKGAPDAAAVAREKAYREALNNYSDPEDLRRLGHQALRHCGTDHLPLSEEEFEGTYVSFGDGDSLHITSYPYEPKVPAFPDNRDMGLLAIRAYGLAWLHYVGRYDTDTGARKDEVWGELLSVEGLRAAFLAAQDLDAAAAACERFETWLDDFEETFAASGLLVPFLGNFGETRGYLRGVRDTAMSVAPAPGTIGRDLLLTRRLLAFQLSELQAELREKRLSPEEIDAISSAMAQKIEVQLNEVPAYVTERYGQQLAREAGGSWQELPVEVQRLLIQAEYLRSVLHRAVDTDWAPVVLHYVRAIETQLRALGRRLDEAGLQRAMNRRYRFSTGRIETFRDLFRDSDFVDKARAQGLADAALMTQLGPNLDRVVRDYRTPAVHGSEPVSPIKVQELRALMFGGPPGGGLLTEIAKFCTS